MKKILAAKKAALAKRWLDRILSSYPSDASKFLEKERDRFANPVGSTLKRETEALLQALLDKADSEQLCTHLNEIIKIRAIQQFAPSQALEFVLRLKEVTRAELGRAAADPGLYEELAALDAQIDRVALIAFDIYVECREQVYQLRINEVKRQVSWIVGKVNQQDPDPELVQISPKPER